MNAEVIFRFLKDINIHNDRIWFNEHREEYDKARLEFEQFLAAVITRTSTFDKTVNHIQPKDCTYRIYRDIRFSADKSPYKRHIGGYINPKGKKSAHSGYYIHLEPDNCMLCSGSICVPNEIQRALRLSVYDNMDEFLSIVEDPSFKQFYPNIGFEKMKVNPRGFPKDYPHMEYLKCKDYSCCTMLSDSFFYSKDLMDKIEVMFRQMKRLNDFLNITIDDME